MSFSIGCVLGRTDRNGNQAIPGKPQVAHPCATEAQKGSWLDTHSAAKATNVEKVHNEPSLYGVPRLLA